MSKFKISMLSIGGIILVAVIVFVVGYAKLGWDKFFLPRQANVQREAFEQTKSFHHGKIQDLAKYYKEYHDKKDPEDKKIIRNVIQMSFSDLDADKVTNRNLRNFLTEMRGY